MSLKQDRKMTYLYTCSVKPPSKLLIFTLHTFHNWDCEILLIDPTVKLQNLKDLRTIAAVR